MNTTLHAQRADILSVFLAWIVGIRANEDGKVRVCEDLEHLVADRFAGEGKYL